MAFFRESVAMPLRNIESIDDHRYTGKRIHVGQRKRYARSFVAPGFCLSGSLSMMG